MFDARGQGLMEVRIPSHTAVTMADREPSITDPP